MNQQNKTLGWGVKTDSGVELWDAEPVFAGERVGWKDRLKLLFYPKKWFLYRHINEQLTINNEQLRQFRILDVGCGTGADVIDLKKMFGRKAEVVGVDVVALEIDIAKEKIKRHGVWAEVMVYDGENLPFHDNSFDAIYTSDVLGHVKNVDKWLAELSRVLKPGGALAMFAESKLGKHAYIRNYLMKRGINLDPHAEFHISLYSKEELLEKLRVAGFGVNTILSSLLINFVIPPESFAGCHPERPRHGGGVEGSLLMLKMLGFINKILCRLKNATHPYSTAVMELCGLIGMLLIGKRVETQGYVVLGEKRLREIERYEKKYYPPEADQPLAGKILAPPLRRAGRY